MSAKGEKVGERAREESSLQAANQNRVTDTSCYEDETETEDLQKEKGQSTGIVLTGGESKETKGEDEDRCV